MKNNFMITLSDISQVSMFETAFESDLFSQGRS
jgi:hypothetical protein